MTASMAAHPENSLPSIGIVTGLLMETAALKQLEQQNVRLRCDGIGPARAKTAAEGLIAKGATALISAGISGGLTDLTQPGSLQLAEGVITPDGQKWACHAPWRQNCLAHLAALSPYGKNILGSDRVIVSEADKRHLGSMHDCLAVDMESQAVASVAAEHQVPFLVVRVVADSVSRTLPSAACRGFKADGSTQPLQVLLGLLCKPSEFSAVMGLKRDTDAAIATLSRVAALGLPFP